MSPVRQVLRRRRITSDATDAPLRSTPDGPLRRFCVVARHPVGPRAHVRRGARDPSSRGAPSSGSTATSGTSGCGAEALHDVGIRHFYDSVGDTTFVYPPGYLYVLAISSAASRRVPSYVLVKLPAILARPRARVGRRRVRGADRAARAPRADPGARARGGRGRAVQPGRVRAEHGLGTGRRRAGGLCAGRRCSCC